MFRKKSKLGPTSRGPTTVERIFILLTVYTCAMDWLNHKPSGPIQMKETIHGPGWQQQQLHGGPFEGLTKPRCELGDCRLRLQPADHLEQQPTINDQSEGQIYASNGNQYNQATIKQHTWPHLNDCDKSRGPADQFRWHQHRPKPWLSWFMLEQAEAIRLVRIEVPHTAQAGQTVRLRCSVDAKGDKLHSLSWYKNGREFYRYQPSERRQPVLAFNTTGVQLDMSRSRNNTITLVNTTLETSGRYKCEATGASFQEAHLEAYLNITPPAITSNGATIEAIPIRLLSLCCMILIINTFLSLIK